jgi:hypothetical protein
MDAYFYARAAASAAERLRDPEHIPALESAEQHQRRMASYERYGAPRGTPLHPSPLAPLAGQALASWTDDTDRPAVTYRAWKNPE